LTLTHFASTRHEKCRPGEGDAGDQEELMDSRPVLVPAPEDGVSEAPCGTLSSGEGSGYDAPDCLLDVDGGSGVVRLVVELRQRRSAGNGYGYGRSIGEVHIVSSGVGPQRSDGERTEDASVVDLISGGRFILGLGLGYRKEEFDGFGRQLKERRGRIEESLEILNKSWSDDPFSFDGKYYQVENLNVTPKPIQQPIPIWIGAFTEPAIRRAARIGAPLYVPAIGVIPIIKYLFDMHSSFLKEYGKNPDEVEKPLVREIYISDKKADNAWEDIKEHVTYTAKGYASWGSMVDTEGNLLSDPSDPILYDLARQQSIIGTPEECVETIRKYQESLPIDNLICRFKFPGISHEEAVRSMKLFVDKVLPEGG